MNIEEFLTYYSLNAPQLMWFLGAGASRSSGMPSAYDIIWDLKRRFYCQKEQQYISDNELSNDAIKFKIDNYLNQNGYSPTIHDEYAHYFQLVFQNDEQLQQKYIAAQLDPDKISINSGHRILSALIALQKARVIFTTNFDSVLENAYSLIESKELHAFSLEGSVAAWEALKDERWPIYAKMHGDFRYADIKNLPPQLLSNDAEIEKCFISACSRYGLIVSGYSGRDKNVMEAFDKAISQPNAFPKGLFWITSVQSSVADSVTALIEKSRVNGINAHIIEAETFDSLLGRIWKIIGHDFPLYDSKIRRSIYEVPKITKHSVDGTSPIIRTNAFPIISMPKTCLSIKLNKALSPPDFRERIVNASSAALVTNESEILAWGTMDEIYKIFPSEEIQEIRNINIENRLSNFRQNTKINSLYTHALARSLVKNKPLKLRKKHGRFYIAVNSKNDAFKSYEQTFKGALASWNYTTSKLEPAKDLAGRITTGIFWMECAELSLEYIDNKFWLIITPDIWVEPSEKRKASVEFLNRKKRTRYNSAQNKLLDAWKDVLLGKDIVSKISPYEEHTDNNPEFEILTTTAYSLRSSQ